jgi:hypothetical protein
MAKKAPEEDGKQYKVGDQIIVKLDERRKVHATIRTVYQEGGKTKLNIDYGHEETATSTALTMYRKLYRFLTSERFLAILMIVNGQCFHYSLHPSRVIGPQLPPPPPSLFVRFCWLFEDFPYADPSTVPNCAHEFLTASSRFS